MATVIALLIVAPTAAHADPYWQGFSMNSTWNCGNPMAPTIYPNAGYLVQQQACIVVSGNYTQSVVIVMNSYCCSITSIMIEAPHVELYQSGNLIYDRSCYRSTLYYPNQSACFGPTTWRACGTWVQAQATVVYQDWQSVRAYSPSRQMCT